jgi:hypothetical protein
MHILPIRILYVELLVDGPHGTRRVAPDPPKQLGNSMIRRKKCILVPRHFANAPYRPLAILPTTQNAQRNGIIPYICRMTQPLLRKLLGFVRYCAYCQVSQRLGKHLDDLIPNPDFLVPHSFGSVASL